MATERYFVVEITPTVASDGSTSTFLFTNYAGGFSTAPTDTPANTRVRGLLRNAGSLRRELFSGARVTGAITPSYGNIVIANPAPEEGEEGLLDDWLDYSVAGARIVVRWGEIGAAYPSAWTTVYIAYGHSMIADLNEITIRLRDRLQVLNKPIVTDGFIGSGGLEGSGGIAKRKQFVSQDPGFIVPILVDVNKQIYFVQSTSTGGLHDLYLINSGAEVNPFDVFDNGVEITRTQPNYASSAELLASSPSAGTVRYWFGGASEWMSGWQKGPVYMRLGSPPDGDIRVVAAGYPTDDDCNRAGRAVGTFSAATLALRAGLTAADLDDSAFNLPLLAQLVDDDRTYLDVLSDASLCAQGWFGFNRLDKFRSGSVKDPESEYAYYGISAGVISGTPPSLPTTSVFTFTQNNITGLRREPVSGMEVPVWSIQVTAGDTWPSQIAGGATATLKDYLTREAWTSFSAVSTSTLLANPGAETESIRLRPRAIQSVFDARLFSERYFALYGGRRDFYTFTVPLSDDVLALDLHDCVTLQVPRFGLSSGRKHRIVGMTIDCGAPRGSVIKFTLWGGVTGQMTGFNGGPGSVPSGPGGPAQVVADPAIALASIGQFSGLFVGGVETSGGGAEGDTTEEDPTSGADVAATRASIGVFSGQFIGSVANESDANFGDVALLAHFNGTDGQITADDDGPIGHTLTRVGTPELDTAQVAVGTASCLFPRTGSGSGDKWTIAAHAAFNLSGDFTIEFRFRTTSASTGQTLLRCEGSSGTGWEILMNNLGNIYFSWINSGTPLAQYSGLSANTWYAFAFQRSGSTISHHLNGSYGSAATSTDSTTMTGDGALTIGGRTGSTSLDMTGWLDEVRITKGVARYGSSNYTLRTTDFPNE